MQRTSAETLQCDRQPLKKQTFSVIAGGWTDTVQIQEQVQRYYYYYYFIIIIIIIIINNNNNNNNIVIIKNLW